MKPAVAARSSPPMSGKSVIHERIGRQSEMYTSTFSCTPKIPAVSRSDADFFRSMQSRQRYTRTPQEIPKALGGQSRLPHKLGMQRRVSSIRSRGRPEDSLIPLRVIAGAIHDLPTRSCLLKAEFIS